MSQTTNGGTPLPTLSTPVPNTNTNTISTPIPLPLPPTNPKPPPYGLSGVLPQPPHKKPHSTWTPSYIHSAQCDGCHTKIHKVMQRCQSCALQYCKECMPKARINGHEYEEEELDWDVGHAPTQYRDHGSLKKKLQRGEKLPLKSRLGTYVTGDEAEAKERDIEILGDLKTSAREGKASGAGKGGAKAASQVRRVAAKPKERLMTEEEKYQGRGAGQGQATNPGFESSSRNYQMYGRHANRGMPDDEEEEEEEEEEEDEIFEWSANKRRRLNGSSTQFASTATGVTSRSDGQRFNNSRNNDGPSLASPFNYSSNNSPRLIHRQQAVAAQQQQQQQQRKPQRQPASVATSRQIHSHSQSQIYQHPQQAHLAFSMIPPATIRRAASLLSLTSTFSEATDAILQAREYYDSLPLRRQQFEEYCRQAKPGTTSLFCVR